MRAHILVLISSTLLITACKVQLPFINIGDKEETERAATPTRQSPAPAPAPQDTGPSACELLKTHYENHPNVFQEPSMHVSIQRHFQRVQRRDCHGAIVSDRNETVVSPRKDIVLKPLNRLKNAHGVELFNADNCENVATELPNSSFILGELKPITGDSSGQLLVKTDLAPATFTFRLKEGLNRVYYTYFKGCVAERRGTRKAGPGRLCPDSQELQVGVYNITVDYREETLNGILELKDRRKADQCKR